MSGTFPANPTAQTIVQSLVKLQDADPDYRYMSLNDLCQALTVGRPDILQNDYNTASRTVDGIFRALGDPNAEVQNIAIKWYAGYDSGTMYADLAVWRRSSRRFQALCCPRSWKYSRN